MPIPSFDSNLVLPPHVGDPSDSTQLSPYPCSAEELCRRFATTTERRKILGGLLQFRDVLTVAGFSVGFQWLDGSFMEDVEAREARAPADLDLITFVLPPDPAVVTRVVAAYPIFADHNGIKTQYHLDHYFVNMAYNPITTVELTRYWVGLFSHRRDGIWKGMLRLELNTPLDDAAASNFLGSLP